VDVGDGPAVKAWVEATAEALGGLDIVVSNVSGFGVTSDETGWRRSFEIDVMGTVHVLDAALPFLKASEAAVIVVISTAEGDSRSFGAQNNDPLEVLVFPGLFEKLSWLWWGVRDERQRWGRKPNSWVKYHGKRGQIQRFSSIICVDETLPFSSSSWIAQV
jgi:NAD(P)-dependent dehydrogenase (short-subunit alcohol dehydrogenase family)